MNQKGFAHMLLIILILAAIITYGLYYVTRANNLFYQTSSISSKSLQRTPTQSSTPNINLGGVSIPIPTFTDISKDCKDNKLGFNPKNTVLATLPEMYLKLSNPPINYTDRLFSTDGCKVFTKISPVINNHIYTVLFGNNFQSATYSSVREMGLSPDNQHLWYIASNDRVGAVGVEAKEFMVVDGKQGKPYDRILSGVVFSPDGKQYAYGVEDNRQGFIVLNGIEQKHYQLKPTSYQSGFVPTFSPDEKEIAYKVESGDSSTIVKGNKTLGPFDSASDLRYSLDGKHFFYISSKYSPNSFDNNNYFNEDYVTQNFPVIGDVKFSADDEHYAYVSQFSNNQCGIIVDGEKVGNLYNQVSDPQGGFDCPLGFEAFSPDDTKIAYETKDEQVVATLSDKEIKKISVQPSDGNTSEFIFSPDGHSFAYINLLNSGEASVNLNGVAKKYDEVDGDLHFSLNSKYLGYGVRNEQDLEWIVEPVNSTI